ncbi:sulfotransferase-like domain-containing protein [Parerythrobacter jejuensis]|uniref:HAD family hydrolase n=1 Tax=Parerythrobacter jejuensis TaxID=795812 RepID=A0A845ATA5_9SPHN|nr:sulfotransferase [Parerythrobacter jejuensis]MXP32373.1 HAD family hydrolase [Parerythrobacter jejuensis]
MTIRIAMWSGPRNLSTAMMRSFSSRSDTFVSDEPFYGAYLKETGDPQPMAQAIIDDMDCDWHSVARTLGGTAPEASPVWYQKHMPHHMEGPIDILDLPDMRHAFLIRDPVRVAASYANKRTAINADHLGTVRQRRYFEQICDRDGAAPPVVDSAAILADPATILGRLCEALGIAWDSAMLGWAKGPHPQDGIWQSHWYDKVNASTGFGSPPGPLPVLSEQYQKVADACREDYEALRVHAITA